MEVLFGGRECGVSVVMGAGRLGPGGGEGESIGGVGHRGGTVQGGGGTGRDDGPLMRAGRTKLST